MSRFSFGPAKGEQSCLREESRVADVSWVVSLPIQPRSGVGGQRRSLSPRVKVLGRVEKVECPYLKREMKLTK